LVIARVPAALRHGTARRLQARLQARGSVFVVVGDPGAFACDVTIATSDPQWDGLGHGSGRLARRRASVAVTRPPSARPRRAELWLPGADGRVEAVHPVTAQVAADIDIDRSFRRTG